MIEVQSRKFLFKKRNFWFAEEPFDVKNCDAAFFYAVPDAHNLPGFRCTPSETYLIDLSLEQDDLMKSFSKNCRYKINRGIREGLTVKQNHDHEEFYEVYRQFVKTKGFAGDLDLYWDIARNGKLFTCYYEDKLLGGLLVLQGKKKARWFISASTRLNSAEKKLVTLSGFANRLLVWEAIKEAKSNGLRWFDLGGHYTGDDESNPEYLITQMKRSFGGQAVTLYKYSKCYSLPLRLLKKLKASRA